MTSSTIDSIVVMLISDRFGRLAPAPATRLSMSSYTLRRRLDLVRLKSGRITTSEPAMMPIPGSRADQIAIFLAMAANSVS